MMGTSLKGNVVFVFRNLGRSDAAASTLDSCSFSFLFSFSTEEDEDGHDVHVTK